MPKHNYDARYSETWDNAHLWLYHIAVNGKCCYCLTSTSQEVHHVRYVADDGAPNAGREILGTDIFPVCKDCHRNVIHSCSNWIVDRVNPDYNRSTPETVQRLRIGYVILST